MKAILSLIVLLALYNHHSDAQSLSAEAKDRQGKCGGLVKPKPKPSTPAPPSTPSAAPSPSGSPPTAPSVSPPSPSAPTGPPPTEGQCEWVCTSPDDVTGVSDGATGEVTGVSGGVSGGVTPPAGSSPKPGSDYDCELTEAFYNWTILLTAEQQVIWLQFIEEIKVTILIDVTLTDIEKVVKCSYALKRFCRQHDDIYKIISFEVIGSWGFCIDFFYVSIDLQAQIIESIVTIDSNGNCTLFEALLNATQGNAEQHQAVIVLIEELRIILESTEYTFAQKLAKCHESFEFFFEEHVEWQSFFFSIEISGFGSFESCFDVCHGYRRVLTLSVVISGSSDSDCVLLSALTAATANTSFSVSVRNQIKAIHDKCVNYWASTTDIQLRLSYVSSQCYQLFAVEFWIQQYLDQISLEVSVSVKWGIFYDLLWCSQFCKNSGNCGPIDHGMGTTVAASTASSTPASTASSTAASTTTTAASTSKPPPDCPGRSNLIVVQSTNTTYLTDTLSQHYGTWNSSVRSGFNTCYNKIRNAIWNNSQFPDSASKLVEIVNAFLAYNPNNANAQNVVMTIQIEKWSYYTIRDFCNCQSSSG